MTQEKSSSLRGEKAGRKFLAISGTEVRPTKPYGRIRMLYVHPRITSRHITFSRQINATWQETGPRYSTQQTSRQCPPPPPPHTETFQQHSVHENTPTDSHSPILKYYGRRFSIFRPVLERRSSYAAGSFTVICQRPTTTYLLG
jgi:hypothetical protein